MAGVGGAEVQELASVLKAGVRCLGFAPSIKEASGEGEQESAMC